ncbi:MAG TPA: FtsW/RodA/SpoVE family cell cycle protein [Candidatus Faecousia intestinigallinarum]|nr:FtsW/RodA/SpoVE family cell cycle protein [Candidatus Faecousia intestinigallinarum]
MDELLTAAQADKTAYFVFIGFLRYAAPILALLLLIRCCKPLLTFRREPEIWAWLCLKDGKKLPITHWENVIGRSKRSDVIIDFPTVSRNHGVLTRYDDGSWTISDANSKDGVLVNGRKVSICALEPEDVISIGGVEMQLQPISSRQEAKLAHLRTKAASPASGMANLILLSLFQALCALGFVLAGGDHRSEMVMGFAGLMLCQWLLFIFYLCIRRSSFEVETIAFFLCTMGFSALATVAPEEIKKQFIAVALGIIVFFAVGWSLRDLERAKKIRYFASLAGVGFLLITLVFGEEYYGAKNWLFIGNMSIQPSELTKVCFVFVGASTMDRLMNKRNLILFIAYSAFICGCLALMNDFGTALIFFCAFLVIAFLRSGSVGTVALAIAALVFAGVVALQIAPHALRRFASWRHIWEDPLDAGYQQTRALMCIASGGLLGLGPGRGWMENVFAADSDMVFATISEEWGLIMAAMLVVAIAALAVFAVRSAAVGRSSFYVIGACTAASILLVQTILNVLGTVDLLPLTGVTFPFLSNGGSSMICSWGLLAFVKAADTRQNASFAVRLSKKEVEEDE